MAPYKGHRRSMGKAPLDLPPIPPQSTSSEPLRQTVSRQRDVSLTRQVKASRRAIFWRRFAVIAAVVVVFALVGTALGGYLYVRSIDSALTKKFQQVGGSKLLKSLGQKPIAATQPFWMVLMGVDTRPNETIARSDTLLLAYVDPPRKRVTLVSIPRDTKVQIPGYSHDMKINSAAQLGGPKLVIDTLADLTGIRASHFVMVDFNGFKDLVDAIGGVYINVPTRVFDPKAANHDYTAEIVLPGYKKLDGKHALTFVRSRNFPEGDFQRIRNQQAFIKALAKQTLQIQNVFRLNAIVDAVVKNVTTDMNLGELANLADQFRGTGNTAIQAITIPATPKYIGGVAYVITDKAAVQELFARVEAGESVEATKSAAATASATGAIPVAAAHNTTLIVRNGTSTAGVAKTAAAKLATKGFKIKEVGNAQRKVYTQTLIIYKTDPTKAQLVADDLGYGRLVQSLGRYSFNTDVLVVIGSDHTP